MNTNDSVEAGGAVIHVPFWVVVLVSVCLLLISVAIYWLTTGSFAP